MAARCRQRCGSTSTNRRGARRSLVVNCARRGMAGPTKGLSPGLIRRTPRHSTSRRSRSWSSKPGSCRSNAGTPGRARRCAPGSTIRAWSSSRTASWRSTRPWRGAAPACMCQVPGPNGMRRSPRRPLSTAWSWSSAMPRISSPRAWPCSTPGPWARPERFRGARSSPAKKAPPGRTGGAFLSPRGEETPSVTRGRLLKP